ncbi:MAG: MFS transporter [Salinarimonas sp.]
MRWRERLSPDLGLGRDLSFLLGGQLVATTGSRIFDIVLIWYALDQADDYATVGFLVFLRFVPYAIFGMFCGWLSDRLNRRTLVVLADLLRTLIFAAAGLALMTDADPLVILAVTAFLMTTTRTLSQPAVQGMLPQLAGGGALLRANATLHGGMEMVGVAAPVIGGFLLAVLPASSVLFIVGICQLFAAALAAAIRLPRETRPVELRLTGFLAEYSELFHVLIRSRSEVFSAIIVNVVGILGVAGILSLLIPILVKDHLNAGPAALGVLWGVVAIGTIFGAAVSIRLTTDRRERDMLLAWLGYGILIGIVVLPSQFIAVLVIGFVLGAVGAVADVLFATLIQERMPKEHVSKTFAAFSTFANVGEAISAPALALATTWFGIGAAFALGASFPIVAALGGFVVLRRRASSASLKSQG